MQFMLVRSNGPENSTSGKPIIAMCTPTSTRSSRPSIRYPIDQALAARGEAAFSRVCAECHGTYGKDASYPRTAGAHRRSQDRPRAARCASRPKHRDAYGQSWFADYRRRTTSTTPAAMSPRRSMASGPAPRTSITAACRRSGTCCIPKQRPVVWRADRRRLRPGAGRPGGRDLRRTAERSAARLAEADLLRHPRLRQISRRA